MHACSIRTTATAMRDACDGVTPSVSDRLRPVEWTRYHVARVYLYIYLELRFLLSLPPPIANLKGCAELLAAALSPPGRMCLCTISTASRVVIRKPFATVLDAIVLTRADTTQEPAAENVTYPFSAWRWRAGGPGRRLEVYIGCLRPIGAAVLCRCVSVSFGIHVSEY